MKKYTLEQLKTEKIAIETNKETFYPLMKKLYNHNIIKNIYGGDIGIELTFSEAYPLVRIIKLGFVRMAVYSNTITPDQIDWGEEEKKGIYHTERSIVLREYMPLPYSGPKQSKTPAVFIKAQKDWSGFKAFLKEVEAHGRTLTSAQLKAYMAKERKLRGGK